MLNNIVRSDSRLEVTYGLRFYHDACGGFEFPCDVDGILLQYNMTEVAFDNYNYCIKHPEEFPYAFNEVKEYRRWIKDTPYGTCHCGERVYLANEYMGACQCPRCGQWYNLFGQELVSPENWDELDVEAY